jgi:hypothetical protein
VFPVLGPIDGAEQEIGSKMDHNHALRGFDVFNSAYREAAVRLDGPAELRDQADVSVR